MTVSMIEGLPEPSADTTTEPTNVVTQPSVTPVVPDTLSNGDLPWAIVLLPTTSSGLGGIGSGKNNLLPGSWVFGFFADGDSCQQPVIIGTIPGGSGQLAGSGNQNDGSTSGSPNETGSTTSHAANAGAVYAKLKSLGYNHYQTAGIMGNLQVESGLNPGIVNTRNPGNDGGATGIAQWRGSRKTKMLAYLQQHGKPYPNLDGELEYLDWEIKTGFGCKGTMAGLSNSRSAAEAAYVIFTYYEIPKDGSLSARQKAANGFAKQFEGSGLPGGGVSQPGIGRQ